MRWTRTISAFAVIAGLVAFGSFVRIDTAFSLPEFDKLHAEGMLKSDPGLLYYLTQSVVEAGGHAPPDFRADPRVEHPLESDLPAMFTVGQEFVVAWAYLVFGGDVPLHTFAVVVMGIIASLAVVGVFGLALELTRSIGWAAFAGVLYALSPANYRTMTFIFMREDLSLPLFAIHLWLLARAARLRTPVSFVLAALSLLLALATWHAMGLVVLIETVCLFAWFLRTGRSPLAARGAWLFVAVLAVGSCVVPVLRAKLFVLSPVMQLAGALLVAAAFEKRSGSGPQARVAVGLVAWVAFALLSLALAGAIAPGFGDYGHVFDLVGAKLRFLGQRPDDPTLLPFCARIMWQGPFVTGSPEKLMYKLLVPLLLLLVALPRATRTALTGRGDARIAVLVLSSLACVFASLGVWRMRVVLGLIAPVVGAVTLRSLRPAPALAVAVLSVAVQAWSFRADLGNFNTSWYQPKHQTALAHTVGWIRENLPPDGAIASDVWNSTAILAHTRHPIVLQPKYETTRSRERLEAFVEALYGSSPQAFSRFLRKESAASYLLVDVPVLRRWRYHAGVPPSVRGEPPGSAAQALLHRSSRVYGEVPGFTLLYESSPRRHRLYRIE